MRFDPDRDCSDGYLCIGKQRAGRCLSGAVVADELILSRSECQQFVYIEPDSVFASFQWSLEFESL